ncbi:hypothetical protein Sgleb_28970 [Streptomyces glebosus]|uniref:Uncharacterized protein n=1 Tax=Streptomyces glebosus TaxID=249580 RepID=A0A640SV19_9ACTN|nr:hypothetical protein [Streptomyces glebosus]GFE14850.1 hypothetical protein Sgleb_28970 [Streptomyces glebosus]GHG87586.1 hypothetical protein GCM10010513_69310 [Streptomyces glebosus]
MTRTDVPAQPGESGGPPRLGKPDGAPPLPPLPPTPPGVSDATRLLCAGTYMDDSFRDAVIDELYVHEERFAAPSLGIDAARVLAHALRARRLQLGWAAGILLLWIVALPLSSGLAGLYVVPVALMALARIVRRSPVLPGPARFLSFVLRWYGRLTLAFFYLSMLAAAFIGGLAIMGPNWLFTTLLPDALNSLTRDSSDGYGSYDSGFATTHASGLLVGVWIALLLPLVLAVLVGLQRGQFARVLAHELSRERFPDVRSDPAERSESYRFLRLRDRVRTEQHGPLVMYRAANPFCGAGQPYKTWSLSVELNPRADRTAEPLDNSAILARIVPLVAALRVPSPHGSPAAAAAVRDRLRALEIDECVFLPAEGLPSREAAPYAPAAFEEHRAAAVEEGGETRRHFLRIRVGGWNEGIVTTVFVRVHTQGGMLMLEVAPHVLWPLRQLFQDADRLAYRYRHHHHFGKAVWALARTPRSAGHALGTLARGLLSAWRLATAGHGAALPEGPGVAVRELGSFGESSLFQDMDVARYLKTIQQRVTAGVTTALREAGYQTDEFEQRVVQVAKGGVYVESAQGAVGIGDHNTITHNSTPPRGTETKGSAKRGNG